ncbi:MAG: Tar ligand binding domain-containing protein, partial [Janthinobacterium sp.]
MLSNITIKMRLIATMSVLGVLIALLGVMSIISLKSANNNLNEVYSNQLASTQAIGESQIALGRARFTMDRVMVHPEAADAKDTLARAEQFLETSNKSWKVYLALPQSAEEKGLSDDMDKKRNDYINNGMLAMSKALRENNIEQADKLMMKGLSTLYRTLDQAAETLTQYQVSSAARMYAESQSNYHTQVAMAIAGMVAGALLTIISSFLLLRAIFGPLDQALRHFGAISDGNLANDIIITRQD